MSIHFIDINKKLKDIDTRDLSIFLKYLKIILTIFSDKRA